MSKTKKEPPFHRIRAKLWASKRFQGLPPNAKLLWFYFATSPHHGGAACYQVSLSYAASDMGLSKDEVADALKCLIDGDLILWDDQTDEVMIRRWFKHAQPSNPKHAAGFHSYIMKIESNTIADAALAELEETPHGWEFIHNPSSAGKD